MRFEWDSAKDKTNRTKHGISFQEAAELFSSSVDYLDIYDQAHSDEEERLIAIGPVKRRVSVVAYTEREDDFLRILPARSATRKERRRFEEFMRRRHERRDS